MAKITLNKQDQAEMPTLILQNRNFENIGVIANPVDLTFQENFNSADELSFTIYKEPEGNISIWDKLTNGMLIYVPEFEERFELSVSTVSENLTGKSVTATSLCEAELSQIKLYNYEINTDSDISFDAYEPTVFYQPEKPEYSLLHRLLEKAPHYSIAHVDDTLCNIQRTFSISDSDLYSTLTGEIAEEFHCIFVFDSINRTISAHDLYHTCRACGYRGEFTDQCPKCQSTDLIEPYGEDTTVFISNDNLASQIQLEADWGSLKNCFYVEGGDDTMNAALRALNPNGTNYIYYFSDEAKADMPKELVDKLDAYDEKYQEYQTSTRFHLDPAAVDGYNAAVDYVNELFAQKDSKPYQKLSATLTGYTATTTAMYEAIDLYTFLKTSMMPTAATEQPTLSAALKNIESGFAAGFTLSTGDTAFKNEIAMLNPASAVQSKVELEILKLAKLYYSDAYFKLKLDVIEYTQAEPSQEGNLKFHFVLTSLTQKDEDSGEYASVTSEQMDIAISDNYELYTSQRIYNAMANRDSLSMKDLTSLNLSDEDFCNNIQYYSLDELNALMESFQSCMDILVSETTNATEFRDRYYEFYERRLNLIAEQCDTIQRNLDAVATIYCYDSETGETSGILYDIRQRVMEALHFQNYIGDFWKTFCSYRREDKYSNPNYISVGSSNSKIMEDAETLLDVANTELLRAGTLQHSISTTMNNLLVLKEFAPLREHFAVGNWIRVGVDDTVYRLRLLSYQVRFDDLPSIQVEFSTAERIAGGISDVKSILDSAQSIASSYDSVKQQAKNSTDTYSLVNHWVNDGLSLTNQKIVTGADRQNILIDEHGILARRYDDIEDIFDKCQLKIFNNGLYITDDGWHTLKTALGKFAYTRGKEEHIAYGILADTIVGRLIFGEELEISNSGGGMTFNQKGLTITNGKNTVTINPNDENNRLFKITDSNKEDVFYTDSEGNISFSGELNGATGVFSGNIKADSIDISTNNGARNSLISLNASGIYMLSNQNLYIKEGIEYFNQYEIDTYSEECLLLSAKNKRIMEEGIVGTNSRSIIRINPYQISLIADKFIFESFWGNTSFEISGSLKVNGVMFGYTSISDVGDGTVTGAIDSLDKKVNDIEYDTKKIRSDIGYIEQDLKEGIQKLREDLRGEIESLGESIMKRITQLEQAMA